MEDKEFLQDPEETKRKEDEATLRRAYHEEFMKDWRDVLALPAGRRIFWDLLGELKFQGTILNSDPIVMAGNAALHDMGVKIFQAIEESVPGTIARMAREIKSQRKSNESKGSG